MDERKFKKLCQITDKILLENDKSVERIAVSWLHIVREHPVFIEKYQVVFSGNILYKYIFYPCYVLLRNLGTWARQVFRASKSKGKMWSSNGEIPHEVDVLLVSHLINEQQAGNEEDFYYGTLPNQLIAEGLTVATALINYTDCTEEELANQWASTEYHRFILSRSLGFLNDYVIFCRLIKEAFKINSLRKREANNTHRYACRLAAIEALSGGSMSALRIGYQIAELSSKIKPKILITTFEGHAWERVAFSCARKARPNIKCIGYQHAALSRLQHSMTRTISKEFDPDCILAAGSVSARQLKSRCQPSIPVKILGSSRNSVLADADSNSLKTESVRKKVSILVMPEGLISECEILLGFSLECAKLMPDVTFVWRLHPLITFNILRKRINHFDSIPSNIILSQEMLHSDISRCEWALYRGSTAIIPAVVNGLRPIYLQLPDELTIDPLYEINEFRRVVRSCEEFIFIIRRGEMGANSKAQISSQNAKEYCEAFYSPLRSEVIGKIIDD